MIERKKKLRLLQFVLLVLGIFIIYLGYYNKESELEDELISKTNKEKLKKKNLDNNSATKDIFFDIEYTGLDLSGNRYILKSKEAYLDELKPEIIYMKNVKGVFYFKDNTILYIWADNGIYNNQSFDMKFENNVKADYLNSQLFAKKANYSNTESYLSISENVRINDIRGNMIADKLLFDITSQKLDITSFSNGKINANVNLK